MKDLKVNQIQIYCMGFSEECVLCGHGCTHTHCLHSVSKDTCERCLHNMNGK